MKNLLAVLRHKLFKKHTPDLRYGGRYCVVCGLDIFEALKGRFNHEQ